MSEKPQFDVVLQEQQRLSDVLTSIEETARQNRAKIVRHDAYTAELEKERLESVSWREKNSLTEKLIENDKFDPARYLTAFEMTDSPYFGVVGINDNDKRIGAREYLIGKQGFMSHDNRALVVDWRKAPISRFFYDYDLGDEYFETIQGRDREGVITRRDSVEIVKRCLRRLECGEDLYELAGDAWVKNARQFHSTTDTKTANQDHRMVDIVSLITPAQFLMITAEATD